MMPANPKLVILYQEMATLTAPECANTCRVPHSCCDEMACQITKQFALEEYGVTLPEQDTRHGDYPHKNAFYLGPDGCTVAPHLRPHCTMHTCAINGLGFKHGDPDWTKRYFKLRTKIERIQT